MKILTLNTHSIVENNYEDKLIAFVEMLKEVKPDVFALQEVNQSLAMPAAEDVSLTGYVKCQNSKEIIHKDNHAYRVAKMLLEAGEAYQWTWISAKIGYDIYDEGIAIFSKTAIEDTEWFYSSQIQDYNNWKTRKILGVCVQKIWYYSVHMGWWNDGEEPFAAQWDKITGHLGHHSQCCFMMGDFNSPADKRDEGYDCVIKSGWMDTWQMASAKDSGITVGGVIDGWTDKAEDNVLLKEQGMRIDFIFCNKSIPVKSSKVICNGINYPVVSDHYGVVVEISDN